MIASQKPTILSPYLAEHTYTKSLSGNANFNRQAIQMFEPVEGKRNFVLDAETGIEMSIRGMPDLEKEVSVDFPDGRNLFFTIALRPKYPDRPYTGPDPSNPTIWILMGSLHRVAKFRGGSREENTEFVRFILSGLSKLNHLWPLFDNPLFYSDRNNYVGREEIFSFILPSEEEIARL
jgi:hypothetical protein